MEIKKKGDMNSKNDGKKQGVFTLNCKTGCKNVLFLMRNQLQIYTNLQRVLHGFYTKKRAKLRAK